MQNKHETDLAKVKRTAGAFSRLLRNRSCRERVFMSTPPQKCNPVYKLGKRSEYVCSLLICVLNTNIII